MKHTVFISHSSKDKAISEKICAFIEAHGISCWIAPRDVTPGKNYGAAIVDAIDECSVFVLVLSEESNKSGQVAREVERAASNNDIIIPFRVDPVEPSRNLEFYVSSSHWLDASSRPIEKHFGELLNAIKDWEQRTEAAPATPATSTASPPPLPPISAPVVSRRKPYVPLALGGAAGLGVLVLAFVGYQMLHQKKSREGSIVSAATSPSMTPPLAQPTISAQPSAIERSPAPATASATSSPVSTDEVTSATTAPLLRHRPGESMRATPHSEIAPSPSPTATPTPPRKIALSVMSPAPNPQTSRTSPRSGSGSAEEAAGTAAAPLIGEVAASSQFSEKFRPNLAFDGNGATAWVPKTGGIKQSIIVHFKKPAAIRSVSILNGDARDEEHYRESNRIQKLRVTLSDGTNQVLTFEDQMKMQRFELPHKLPTEWINFEILSVVRGSKTNRSGIAEIVFNQDPSR